MATETEGIERTVNRLVLEYAQLRPATALAAAPLDRGLTLRGNLCIDSLALVSLTLRLGEELAVDVVESGLEFGQLQTVGDLLAIAARLAPAKVA